MSDNIAFWSSRTCFPLDSRARLWDDVRQRMKKHQRMKQPNQQRGVRGGVNPGPSRSADAPYAPPAVAVLDWRSYVR